MSEQKPFDVWAALADFRIAHWTVQATPAKLDVASRTDDRPTATLVDEQGVPRVTFLSCAMKGQVNAAGLMARVRHVQQLTLATLDEDAWLADLETLAQPEYPEWFPTGTPFYLRANQPNVVTVKTTQNTEELALTWNDPEATLALLLCIVINTPGAAWLAHRRQTLTPPVPADHPDRPRRRP